MVRTLILEPSRKSPRRMKQVERMTGPVAASSNAPLSDQTDEALLVRYRDEADKPAFDEGGHRYERELYSYLRRYLDDATMTEDVFQQTFCRSTSRPISSRPIASCGLGSIRLRRIRPSTPSGGTNATAWSVWISATVMAGRRCRALLDLLVNSDAGPVAELEGAERRSWIREAVNELPETLKSAVTLIYYQGLKYREAADVLNVPVGTVKSRLHTAILKLNEMWMRNRRRDVERCEKNCSATYWARSKRTSIGKSNVSF